LSEKGEAMGDSTAKRPAEHTRAARAAKTAESILRCATRRFWRDGYAATTVRAVAQDAGVDPALVIRYFGSKEELFLRALPVEEFWRDVLSGPVDSLGTRLVDHLLDQASSRMLSLHATLIRASDRPAVRRRLFEIVDGYFIDGLKDRLPGPNPELRAHVIAAQVGGLLQSLSISDALLADYEHAAVVSVFGRAIQAVVES
jgi:AcrR family transcriptional regulator